MSESLISILREKNRDLHFSENRAALAWSSIVVERDAYVFGFSLVGCPFLARAGEQQCPRGCSFCWLSSPAGGWGQQRAGAQPKEGLSLPTAQPARHSARRQRTGGEHLQHRWEHRVVHFFNSVCHANGSPLCFSVYVMVTLFSVSLTRAELK